ncbi:MAG TPA: hypothetical protein VNJ51_13080 [Candidatus Dormibacteraeota bacterium]|nr:hypothetical protein [Candidatus Dormibacteraeota bacterium]
MTAMLGLLRRWVARRVARSLSQPVDAAALRCVCSRYHSLYLRPGYLPEGRSSIGVRWTEDRP